MHVSSPARETPYARHAKRGHAATDRVPSGCGILPAFTGRLIHDGWAPYWHYRCRHGLCNAHHLRALAPWPSSRGRPGRPSCTTREDAVLAFWHDWAVPFDSHQAERDLRMLKVQQKISGTFREAAGADACCRIRGSVATLRKQARHVLTALELAVLGQLPLPCLLPE